MPRPEILTEVSSADMVLQVNGRLHCKTTPLVRATDPHTSQEAAAKCENSPKKEIEKDDAST